MPATKVSKSGVISTPKTNKFDAATILEGASAWGNDNPETVTPPKYIDAPIPKINVWSLRGGNAKVSTLAISGVDQISTSPARQSIVLTEEQIAKRLATKERIARAKTNNARRIRLVGPVKRTPQIVTAMQPAFPAKPTSRKEVTPIRLRKRKAPPSPGDFRPLVKAVFVQPKVTTFWDDSTRFADLVTTNSVFTERPVSAPLESKRQLAPKVPALDDRVVRDFTVNADNGARLEVLETDFRYAVRHPSACIAVETAADFTSLRNGSRIPLTYLYNECLYPKPSGDDYVNSHVCRQVVSDKVIYSLITRQQTTVFTKISDLEKSMTQLSAAMSLAGDTEVTMPFLHLNVRSMTVSKFMEIVQDTLLSSGISVRLVTTSPGLYFASLAALRKSTQRCGVVKVDASTPKAWVPVEGQMHYHRCFSCLTIFSHWHSYYNVDHPQFDYQCPNKTCSQYHKGNNYSNAQVEFLCEEKVPHAANDVLLQDSKWVKEASVFPAAIETAIEGFSKLFGYATDLFPKVIEENSKLEVIELRKTGYAGAVVNKPRPQLIHISKAVGLGEIREKVTKPKPVVEGVKPGSKHTKLRQFPVKPKKTWVPAELGEEFCQISGRQDSYGSTRFRSGLTRRQAKLSARQASNWVHSGCPMDWQNRYAPLLGLKDTDIKEEKSKCYPEDDVPTIIRPKARKVKLSDEYWMEFFKNDNPINITYEMPRNIHRLAKKVGIRARHTLKDDLPGTLDVTGPISILAQVTNKVLVISDTDELVPCQVLDATMKVVKEAKNGLHEVGDLRVFYYDGNLRSGDPVLNTRMQLCSVVTVSDGVGNYALHTRDMVSYSAPCVGTRCSHCKLYRSASWHNNPPKKRGGNKTKSKSNVKRSAPPNMAKIAADTKRSVELTVRAKHHAVEMEDLSRRVARLNTEAKKTANALATMVPVANIKPKAKKKKPTSRSYNLLSRVVSTATGGLVGPASTSTTLLMLTICLLSLVPVSLSCFSGFTDGHFVAGRVSCGSYEYNETHGHYLNPGFGGSKIGSNVIIDTIVKERWDYLNRLIGDVLPCNVVMSKDDNSMVIDGVVIDSNQNTSNLAWSAWVLLITVGLVLVLLSRKKNKEGNHRSRRSIYRETVELAIVATFFLSVIADSSAAVLPRYNDAAVAKPEEVVVNATEWLQKFASFFNAKALSAKQLRASYVDLEAIKKTLEGVGEKGMNALSQVNHLKKSLIDRVNTVESLASQLRALKNDTDRLKAEIEALRKALNDAASAFSEYELIFKRSAEIPWDNLDEVSEQDLEDDVDLFTNMKSGFIKDIGKLERSKKDIFGGSLALDRKTNDEPDKVDLMSVDTLNHVTNTPNKERKTTAARSSGNEPQQATNNSNNSNETSEKPNELGWLTNSEPKTLGKVKESIYKVKYGVNGDIACDTKDAVWYLYEGWETCSNHCEVGTAVGSGWNTCSIGNSYQQGNKLLVKKNSGPRQLCSVSCFDVNYILRAMRYNMESQSCWGPLLFSSHWKIEGDYADILADISHSKGFMVLSSKISIIKADMSTFEFKMVSKSFITECCSGLLASDLNVAGSFYDGPCLCKPSLHNVERRIKTSILDYYKNYVPAIPAILSARTVASVGVIVATAFMSPALAVVVGLGMFAYNANAECSIKNYHTLYVGDSSSKQIYTTLYMRPGDCFTLGENTFELVDIDNTYKYKKAATYPSQFAPICTDIDWGCGLSEGSKICADYNKDCKTKCDSIPGAIYKAHCLHTTTFHGDGCFGFMVQDHSVAVHGGVCLATNSSTPYYGYSRVEGLVSRKFTFKVSAFDQSRTIVVDSKDLIFEDADFTIQDIVFDKTRIPTYVLDAGSIMCAYTDVTGNDFCHSVVTDASKLTNPGCINLDWTFLGDSASWQIDDNSAVITPYVYDLFEACNTEIIKKDGDVIDVSPNDVTLAFKIDSSLVTSAIKATRCAKAQLGGHDSIPGFVDRVQMTSVSVSIKAESECYVSIKLDKCSLLGMNYCKVTTTDTTCTWVIYCPIVTDLEVSINGASELGAFNVTSGKFSAPTLEYSRIIMTTARASVWSIFGDISSGLSKATGWIPGVASIKNMLTIKISKALWVVGIFVLFYISVRLEFYAMGVIVGVFAWLYFFTTVVHADTGSLDEFDDLELWHLVVFFLIVSVDWIRLVRIVYTYICRRASGLWHNLGCSNFVVGVPLVDKVLFLLVCALMPCVRYYVIFCHILTNCVREVYCMIARPQSAMFNTEELNHTPAASMLCNYITSSSQSIGPNKDGSLVNFVSVNARAMLPALPSTSFIGDIGAHMFNSPADDTENEAIDIDQYIFSDDDEQFYDAEEINEITTLPPPPVPVNEATISKVAEFAVSSEETVIDGVPRHIYVGESPFRSPRQPKVITRPWSELDEVCVPSTSSKTGDKKAKPKSKKDSKVDVKLKRKFSEKVVVVLHPMSHKYAFELSVELNRIGRVSVLNKPDISDTIIVCRPDWDDKYESYYFEIPFTPEHLKSLGISKERYDDCVSLIKRHNNLKIMALKNAKKEVLFKSVCSLFVENYDYSLCGKAAPRYYVTVPVGGGFDQLEPKTIPSFEKCPKDASTSLQKADWAYGVNYYKLLLLPQRYVGVPKNWIYVASVYIPGKQNVVSELTKYNYPKDTYNKYSGIIDSLSKDNRSVPVKSLASLVTALNMIARSANQRREDIDKLSRPDMEPIFKRVRDINDTDAASTFYSMKADVGDYIKFSVPDVVVSVFKSNVSDFLTETQRTFMVFRNKDKTAPASLGSEYGHIAALGKLMTNGSMKPEQYCKRVVTGKDKHIVYVVANRNSLEDTVNVDILNKGITSAKIQTVDCGVKHIYVCFGDSKIKKYFNHHVPQVIHNLATRGIEITFLVGKYGDMKTVCSHVNAAMKVISNGQPVGFETSIDPVSESVRKDLVTNLLKKEAKTVAESQYYEISIKLLFDEQERGIVIYKRGRVNTEGWTVTSCDAEFCTAITKWRRYEPIKDWGREQFWLYDGDNDKIVGLLPNELFRPKHFGLQWEDTINPGFDVHGPDSELGSPIFLPITGSEDRGGKATYRTFPIVAQDGSLNYCIYTTEMQGVKGCPVVLSAKRLMSGASVYVANTDVDNPDAYQNMTKSSGFITTCSKVKFLGVECYAHKIEALKEYRMPVGSIGHLNKETRFTLRNLKSASAIVDIFKTPVTNESRNVGLPLVYKEDIMSGDLTVEPSGVSNDPVVTADTIDIAVDDKTVKEWYIDWAGYNFSRNEMAISEQKEEEARLGMSADDQSHYDGHIACPSRLYSLDDCPLLDENEGWFSNCSYASEKLFCSVFCGQVHKNIYKQRWVIRGIPAWHRLTSGEGTVEHLRGLMGSAMYQMSHPCLPELDRLTNALSRPGFERRRWYDNILEGIEDDHVFYAFQIANQQRFTRFNRELDATCSELFDFPDTWYGSSWCTPCVTERGHISVSYVRKNALCIHCSIKDQEENFNDFPIFVKAQKGEDNADNDDFYVKLRRACVLLLAQGWNSFDVAVDRDIRLNLGRFAACCTFNQYLFGPHSINIVSINETLLMDLTKVSQLVYNVDLTPECLKVGSDFLMKRGVKTAAILESISLWHSTRKVNWAGVDVARLGLSSTECPEITVTTEDRPTFMGDSMCAIWNISNGIRTGTCYSNGMDLVGSNHCTLGNNIVVETPTPLNNSLSVKRAKYINRIVKSYEGGDVDMHNGMSVYSAPRKGEIYAVINPAQKRGRWLMCTATDEYEPVTKTRFHKFVPVEVDFGSNSVKLADYRLFKGLSGSPIISAKGQCAGTYGLSTNVRYADKSVSGDARDTTLCHAMVTDNAVENENYFVEAARELVHSNIHEWRFSYLEAPTGTGKSTLFPIAIIHAIARVPGLASYNICMLEPTRAAVHNCYNRILALLKKTDDKWKRIYTLRLSTGKRGDVGGDNFKSEGNGKIQLCIATYGRFIAEYQPESTRPHAYNMLLMDEIHTRSSDEDVGTAYLLSSDRRADNVKVCYMTATAVGKVCEKRLCEGKDLSGTRFKITKEYLIETRKTDAAKEGGVITDSSYFTIDLRKARLNLKTKAQYVSWPISSHAGGRCLIFLPSRNDCEKFVGWARTNYPKLKDRFTSLHAGSPVRDLETLHPEAIIGCTDYASTAITVPNCKAVIDFMEDWSPSITLFQNEVGYTYKNTVSKDVVSKQVSVQRMGRTGRTCDGYYFSCASITPIEETRLSESMYARIYFNLLIKMGKPKLLKAFLRDTEEANRIYEHEWLEPDRIADDWMDKGDEFSEQSDKDILHKFILRAARRLQVVRDWDKDQLWWYLNPVVGRDYLSFCYATENEKTHGFGVSSVKVNILLQECWTVVDTDAEAKSIRDRLSFCIESYKEDMSNFDNYVQRAHDTIGAVSIDTLARRAQKTAKHMYDSIDKTVLNVASDATANITVEAAEDEPISGTIPDANKESALGLTLGATAAAATIGVLFSSGVFMYNNNADWQAVEVYCVERAELPDAIFTSMEEYRMARFKNPTDPTTDAVLSTIDQIIEWVSDKWGSLSSFFKNFLTKFVAKRPVDGVNFESGINIDPSLVAVVAVLQKLKTFIVIQWYKYGAVQLGGIIAGLGLGTLYNKMCETFGIIFSNAIIALMMAACSVVAGPVQMMVNAASLVIGYIVTGLFSSSKSLYGGNLAGRAGALLFTAGGGSALAFLLQGSMLSKPVFGSTPNVTDGMIAMINPYNTGVSRVSDGIIIAKMIANVCRKGDWTSTDGLAVGSTLMSMLLRADAMTCMVSATAGLFLGFARVYMSNSGFWFKMTSAVSVKHAETYKDLVEGQMDRFDLIFDSILGVAGVLANPMSLVSIVSNIMADVMTSYMRGDTDIEFRKICVDTAQFYSGVSMIYGLSAAIFKVCFQLKDSVASHFEHESSEPLGIMATLNKLWGMIANMDFGGLWNMVCDQLLIVMPTMSSFSKESYNLFEGFLSKVWSFVKGIFKACYDWCVDKINTFMNRAEKRVMNAISGATSFNLSLGTSISSGSSVATSDSSTIFNLRFQKAAYMWANHLKCPLPASTICDAMMSKKFESYYILKRINNASWLAACGLFGWVCDRWELDPKVLTRYIRTHISEDIISDGNNIFNYVSIYSAMYLIRSGSADYEDLIVGPAAERFGKLGSKEELDDIVNVGRQLEYDSKLSGMSVEEDVASSVDTSELCEELEDERFLLSSERLISSIASMPLSTKWLNSSRLIPIDSDEAIYRTSVDTRFWMKKRLQGTGDNCVIPLIIQSQSPDVSSFGPMPNEILKLDSKIYHNPDKSKGSGDYLSGFIDRPWDVICMDNTALVKLFSTVCPVADNGTHITLSFQLTDSSNMHINISHSFTPEAACIGMLCQTQDSATKLVDSDLAAVEIMLWPTDEGIEMIGTCPPNTSGTWDILYDATLQFLPFFKDMRTKKIARDDCKSKFDHWCSLAAPDDQAELLQFEEWRDRFVSQRFAAMGYFTACKSAVSRNVKTLATRYSKSFAEGKKLNESFADVGRYPYTRELVKYKSYYKDFAEAVHSRLGDRKCMCEGLPDGIEDVRITLSDYAVKAWFQDLVTRGDEDIFDTTLFWVNGNILSEKQRIHHPSVYYPKSKAVSVTVSTLTLNVAKSELTRVGYLMGHNVVFIDVLGSTRNFEMATCAGVCGCTAVYTFNGNVLHSAQGWKCDLPNCAETIEWWTVQNKELDQEECQQVLEKVAPINWLHESGGWLSGITVSSVKDALSAAAGVATKVVQDAMEQERLYSAGTKRLEIENRLKEERAVCNKQPDQVAANPALVESILKTAKLSTDMSGRYVGPTGVPILKEKVLRARKKASAKNADDTYVESLVTGDEFSAAAKKLFSKRKELGSTFFDWIHGMAIAERANHILPKEDTNCISVERQQRLKERYHYLTVEELLDMIALGTEETDDIKAYLEISNRKPICSEAPWCDGWDAVAINSRPQDIWLTDGNTHLYNPHSIDDEVVVRDIIRVERLVNHLPKDVWAECRYKNRLELPAREDEIGNVYASKAACKAQLLYEYLPNFFTNHKKFFEPCCGFGGFAQFFSHQMRNMDTREYYVSSLNMRGHAMPNWSLMQATDSNCRVIRVLDSIRDGNICDPEVNLHACRFIRDEKITMLLFDIGEKYQDPNMDDAWYLAPRNVRGGFAVDKNAKDLGLSIVDAIARMVDSLQDGSDGVFKVNTFSPRLADIIHVLSRRFKKVRALKLATTPEFSREFYLYCSNKRSDWSSPVLRSLLLKDCIKELTWSALFRAENMYRTKGRHATRPRSHKWFTPDSSGISYRMVPNNSDDDKELDSSRLPQGHAINVKTNAHGRDIHVDIEFTPDWDRRFRRVKDYVHKVNRVARDRTGRGRDSVKFDNVVRSDFTFVRGIGSYRVKQKNTSEKHGVNDLLSSYLNSVAGMNMLNATYGQTQATPEFVKPSRKRRLDVQPGQPEPTCVVDFIKAVHCLMSDAGKSMLGKFAFMNKEDTYAFIVKTGSTGILDPGSTLREFMEIFPEWYELAWEHVLNPHIEGKPTGSYQSVRTKPEPKGRKDAEDGRLQYHKGVSNDTLREGTNLSPRFIQFSDALTRIGHIIVFGHILDFHGKYKLYKGSINGTPPHISGRVMRSYWDLHNPVAKRVVHVGNNPELDIFVEPNSGFKTDDVTLDRLIDKGRLGAVRREDDAINGFEDLPGGLTIDFSALDSTVTVSERMVMADLWSRFFDDPRLKQIVKGVCRDMTYAICLDDAGDIWVRDGQRGSGEILTSIENTWLVTANIISAMSHALGISIDSLTNTQGWINVLTQPGGCGSPKVNALEEIRAGAKYKRFEFGEVPLLVDGDDVVIISNRRRIDQIQAYMNQSRQWLSANRKVIRSGNKGGATRYLNFEDLSFCSHRYEAVFIGPDASKFNPKHVPRSDGRYAKRTDLLSVAEDNNFKIYYLPIRPTADILAKLMLTLKVKTFKWDPTKTNPGECVDLTQSKLISYLLLYPQSRWVRYTCLTLLCVTGDNLATFIEFKKRYREFSEFNLKYSSKLLSSMNSLYGVSSLDDISLREYRSDSAEIRKQHYNSRLTGHVCNTTRGKWLQASFDWLDHQNVTDIYPLMWDSSVFKYYEAHVSSTADNSKISTLRELIKSNAKYTDEAPTNTSGLWWRIFSFTG